WWPAPQHGPYAPGLGLGLGLGAGTAVRTRSPVVKPQTRRRSFVLQRPLSAGRLSRAVKACGTVVLEQQCCPVGANPDLMGLDLRRVAAVLGAVRGNPKRSSRHRCRRRRRRRARAGGRGITGRRWASRTNTWCIVGLTVPPQRGAVRGGGHLVGQMR